jgi:hypothetical protein
VDSHDLYSSPNIRRVIKSGRIKWAENMIHRGGEGKHIGILLGNLKETTAKTLAQMREREKIDMIIKEKRK